MSAVNYFLQNYLSKIYIPQLSWTDTIEIIIIAFLLYNILVWIKDTRAWALLKGIIIIGVFTLIAFILDLRTILWIASKTINVGIIALVIIFQPELRRALEQLGRKKILTNIFKFEGEKDERFSNKTINELIRATFELAKDKTGALIVLEQEMKLLEYEKTGIEIDAVVTSQLLINIFEHNTPLHDGAIIIRDNRVIAATCYLPLSDNMGLSKSLGTRHRAAVGISEVTDSFTIIVSEETGAVSVAVGGELIHNMDGDSIRNKLEYMRRKTIDVKSFKRWKGRLKNEGKNERKNVK
ncbi:diadenylate cyclase CdaA [[Clostridium] fimetarium]|uniref:Diadenylate cyclase n=1 Tax=[Clostridium] fimetarium TaxID=99656 RepID=A0A1I0M8D5_9FIRM|nr:diadenylate cyclase CdaA [[Clostridium] fimetarium]SEV84529.1 diadenylate cyclase [[Clostridium] fimetarium]